MSAVQEACNHAREVRNRLRNPQNAVADDGIDLKRKPKPVPIIEIKAHIEPPQPQAFWVCGPIMSYSLSYARAPITIRDIQRMVARHFEISLGDLVCGRRTSRLTLPRWIAMALSRRFTTQSLPMIGRNFGGRDHATVLNAIRKINARRLIDPEVDAAFSIFEEGLKPAV